MTKRALLIGSPVSGLKGVETDIEIMQELLSTYGFSCTPCVGKKDATRRGILDAYDDLIRASGSQDAAVIYYSGHGGLAENPYYSAQRQVSARQPRYHQFIVPVDIYETTDTDFRGITNLEMSYYLLRLTQKTQNAVVILDCCHASGMCRGLPNRTVTFRVRTLEKTWSCGIHFHLEQLRNQGIHLDRLDIQGNPNAVRLVATGPTQPAFEYTVQGRTCGLLTDSLSVCLNEVAGIPLSWRAICRLVRQRVLSFEYSQRPEIEGPRDRLLFEVEQSQANENEVVELRIDDSSLQLMAGSIHGVEIGDKYAIVDRGKTILAGQNHLARAEVVELGAVTCKIHLEKAHGIEKIPQTAVAYPIERALHRLPVAVLSVPGNESIREQIIGRLEKTHHLRLALGDTRRQPFTSISVKDGFISILNPGLQLVVHSKPFQSDANAAITTTLENLRQLARARNLASLASGTDSFALSIPYEVDWGELVEGQCISHGKGVTLQAGGRIYVRVYNRGKEPFYVSFLDIGIAGKITLLNVDEPAGIIVRPNEDYVLGEADFGTQLVGLALEWNDNVPINDGPRRETITVIITNKPQNMALLEAPGARSMNGQIVPKLSSELDRLLSQIVFGSTREVAPAQRKADIRYAVEHIDFYLTPLA